MIFDGSSSFVNDDDIVKGKKRDYKIKKRIYTGATNIYVTYDGVLLKQLRNYTSKSKEFKYFFSFHEKLFFILQNINSVVKLEEVFECGGYLFLARRYYENLLTLDKLITPKLTISLKEEIAKNLISIIKELHLNDIIYTDLKPEQFAYFKDGFKLIDFDYAISKKYKLNRAGGTIGWHSPEHIKNESLTKKSDIFQLGLILYALFTLKHPFIDYDDIEEAILKKDIKPFEGKYFEIISKMLDKNPKNRPLIEEVERAFSDFLNPNVLYLKYNDKKAIILDTKIITRDFCKQIFHNHKKIAPKQFEILKKSDGWYINPLKINPPFFPTKLNSKIVTSKFKLSKGDKIQIDDIEFEIC